MSVHDSWTGCTSLRSLKWTSNHLFYPHVEFALALDITYALVRGVYRDILIPSCESMEYSPFARAHVQSGLTLGGCFFLQNPE